VEFLQTKLHPERYQGRRRRYPYFEGWYYKLIDASEQHRYAVIPGIYKGPDPSSSQIFVQFMDGMTGQVTYYRYPMEAFHSEKGGFDLRVGPNRFMVDRVELQLESPARTVTGTLRFAGTTPWPVTLLSPGIMGWYAWVPFMECYHGVVSLDHEIHGMLAVDGAAVDMTGGRGYTEKDWGRRFPTAWVWFQSNHFEQPGTSITSSVAVIPWLRSAFPGFIIGLWHDRTLYRFTTYTRARIEKLNIGEEHVEWVVRDRRHRLEMRIRRTETGMLYAPSMTDMSGRVAETLKATAAVRLSSLAGQREHTIFEGAARNGGLEIVGETQKLTGEKQ
jgi:hypothetical protein